CMDSASLIEAQAADVEEAGHEEDEERDARPRADVRGEADRADEVEAERELEDAVEVLAGLVLLLRPALAVGGHAVLRRADELDVVPEHALDDGARVVEREPDPERHHQR